MLDIAILIPCYNESKSIKKVIMDFKEQIPEARICVFDNNSTDQTANIAKSSGAEVYYVYKKGKGNVVRSMFKKIDADIYVMVDGDDTYPPTNIREMLQPVINREADMVIGDRLSTSYQIENKRRFHNGGNLTVKYFINKIFKAELHDILTGYRVFSRDFVKSIPIISEGFEIETELTVFALHHNYIIKEVKVPYKDREENNPSKLNTISDGIKIIVTIFNLFRDYKPFLFFSIFGLFFTIIAFIFLIPVFMDYFETGLVERFPTLIFGCFLLLSALLFFCSGLILQVISNHNRLLMIRHT